MPADRQTNIAAWHWLIVLLALLGVGAALLSSRFALEINVGERPVEVLVLLLAAMGVCFLLLAKRLLEPGYKPGLLEIGIGAGVLMRVVMMVSVPMFETDFYRYLWDGAVLAQGVNPYTPIPGQVMEVEGPLTELGRQSGVVISRINHPGLRTVYPPVAQLFFVVSHLIAPWSLAAWRAILFVADGATLALLMLVLREAKLPKHHVLLYWLNPILLKEIYNSAHMDVLLAPFVVGGLLLAMRNRLLPAVCCLAVATGLKVWPVLLLPLVLRAGGPSMKIKFAAVLVYALVVGVIHVPILMAGLDSTSGFTAYAGRWEMNNGPSLVLLAAGRWAASSGWITASGRTISSVLTIIVVGVVVLLSLRRAIEGIGDLVGRALVVTATLYLLSPTQFPWYAVWFLPLLAVRPHMGLLFYAITLPLYYLRGRYEMAGNVGIFDHVIVWLEHGPVLILLLAAKWKPSWIPHNPGSLVSPSSRQGAQDLLPLEVH